MIVMRIIVMDMPSRSMMEYIDTGYWGHLDDSLAPECFCDANFGSMSSSSEDEDDRLSSSGFEDGTFSRKDNRDLILLFQVLIKCSKSAMVLTISFKVWE